MITKEEALKVLEADLRHAELCLEMLAAASDGMEKCVRYEVNQSQREVQENVDTYRMAIAALREQEENRWVPVTERMPEEHESVVPNWGTVSKPLLVAFVCTTSEEPYPKNCIVCETMSHNGMFTHKSYSGEYKAIAWMLKPMPPKENPYG